MSHPKLPRSPLAVVPSQEPPPGRFDDEPASQDGKTTENPWDERVVSIPGSWFTEAPPARKWLLRDSRREGSGFFPSAEVGQLIAAGGVGKSLVLRQLAIAVATGTPWLGTFTVERAGRVAILSGEDSADEERRRLYRGRRATNAPIPPLDSIVPIALSGAQVAMLRGDQETPFLQWVRAFLAKGAPWALVIVDPLSRFAGAESENDPSEGTRFVTALESLIQPSGGASILNAHHTNKISRNKLGELVASDGRGTSALVDGFRWQVGLAPESLSFDDTETSDRLGELAIMSHTKANYSRKAKSILLRRDAENGGALLPLDEADLKLVQEARHASQSKLAKVKEREQDTEKRRSEREKRDEEKKREKEAQKEQKRRAKDLEQDRALVALLREKPVRLSELRPELAARLGSCSHDTAAVVLARLGPAVLREPLPPPASSNARLLRLDNSKLPEALR